MSNPDYPFHVVQIAIQLTKASHSILTPASIKANIPDAAHLLSLADHPWQIQPELYQNPKSHETTQHHPTPNPL